MKKQSRESVSPTPRHLPLVDILIDTELVVASGLKVLCWKTFAVPRYAHQPERQASAQGSAQSGPGRAEGGDSATTRPPRRHGGGPPFTDADPLNRRVVDQMLIGVATRQYAGVTRSAPTTTRGTSKRAVSHALSRRPRRSWMRGGRRRSRYLAGLLIDGVHVGGHCISSPWASIRRARNTRSACGKGPRRTRRSENLEAEPEPPGDRRWGEGPRHGRDRRSAGAPWCSGVKSIKAGTSCGGATAVGDGDPQARLSHTNVKTAKRLQDLARRLEPECSCDARRPRRDAGLGLGLSELFAGHDKRHRESAQRTRL